jgi:hypothetical protein
MLSLAESILMSIPLKLSTVVKIAFLLLLFLDDSLLLIMESLLLFYVFEHVFVFRDYDIVGKHLGVLLIELVHSWESLQIL